jgi:lipopolysaccharide transport system ATP-binding protein
MPDTVIAAEDLSKKYVIGHEQEHGYRTLRDVMTGAARRVGKRMLRPFNATNSTSNGHTEEFWALRDICFAVKQGEVVGIIGRNGAGKSTLLKILSRITEPTSGRVRIHGRVASLLEVGTGFHPELTGRENIFLNGAILGMARTEIRRKFDEIVAFAEIERFLDTPVKRYSSGMYVRLAFAVAAHLEPHILLVDEVLAVGDQAFQRKCLGKMESAALDGRTVLFVSHNMTVVSRLCNRVIWIDAGHINMSGDRNLVISEYLDNGLKQRVSWEPESSSSGAFHYHSVRVLPDAAAPSDSIASNSGVHVRFEYCVKGALPPGRLSFLVTNQEGTVVLTTSNTDSSTTSKRPWPRGRIISDCLIPAHLLAPGRYHVTISEPVDDGSNIIHENIITFNISELNSLTARDARLGVIAPLLRWHEEVRDNG